ncbi:hypothetical protein ANO11243_043860 [Dothideomycetidae sp. 11243]|nr:hypothetical protein ANO11243_043860 [fungal sp. No.11243]
MKVLFLASIALGAVQVASHTTSPLFATDQAQLHSPVTELDNSLALPTNGSYIYLSGMYDALQVMQDSWFRLWIGTWPTSIDWTAAVLSSYVTTALESLSKSKREWSSSPTASVRLENQIEKYFDQTTAFYYGENAFSLRNEANDDMLWVVLNWMKSVNFATAHSLTFRLHSGGLPWHGAQYIPAFVHRARVFYDLAAKGWSTTLCGGGMVWNDNLEPYKNAITNELYISASTQMYLFFPGDNNTSPYGARPTPTDDRFNETYLDNAVQGYAWLKNSNMTNSQGLYVDGFHITGWNASTNSTGTGKCDDRNNMVYTYNQGVLLTGLRGLWEGTGDVGYLIDAHALVRAVIAATGWTEAGIDAEAPLNTTWAGLGRAGILEDYCDANGTCNQDAQTFKGIYMEHLTTLCQPLPPVARRPGKTFGAPPALNKVHLNSCRSYGDWIRHNAAAANSTRDARGRFGMWWGASLFNSSDVARAAAALPAGAVDYMNIAARPRVKRRDTSFESVPQWPMIPLPEDMDAPVVVHDLNGRGRGRTVETQGGGLSVMRAAWEISRLG